MLSKNIVSQVLAKCLITGGDFAEVFVEEKLNNNIVLTSGAVKDIISGKDYGIGIRIFKGLKCIYAYTNDDSLMSLVNTAKNGGFSFRRRYRWTYS